MEHTNVKEHKLFKPKNFEEARHAVVGDCNGFTMEERWRVETPLFAKEILKHTPKFGAILDYGCGVGRIAKEILNQRKDVMVAGVDASIEMQIESSKYVDSERFEAGSPQELAELADKKFDTIYCVYVLQHVPAIEIRDILYRIHHYLKDDGVFIYCSSDYRMAINHDKPGFFDDRFLGVDLRNEIKRLFTCDGSLFPKTTLEDNPVLNKMIAGFDGGLPHPALVYRKKKIEGEIWDAREVSASMQGDMRKYVPEPRETSPVVKDTPQPLILINRLAPGDCLVMTNAIRDLHKAHPGKYLTEVRTPCNDIFENNPYVQPFLYSEDEYQKVNAQFSQLTNNGVDVSVHVAEITGGVKVIDMHYPMIHSSGKSGRHFCEGHRQWLADILGVDIPQTDLRPEIYLTQTEKEWANPVAVKCGYQGKYWVINAGSKGDFTLKQYPNYQEVVNLLIDRGITPVQIGVKGHNHTPLKGAVDMVGKTNLRELFRLIYHAEGVITCVSLPMHVAAAFNKPCVVVAGAREGTRWELYPNQQFMYVNGCLPCASYDGCWKSKHSDCVNLNDGIPLCMDLITPTDIVNAVERYYIGGMLVREAKAVAA